MRDRTRPAWRSIWAAAGLVAAVGLAAACVGSEGPSRYTLERSTDALAADGTVLATAADSGNTRLRVTVEHLAPPDRVAPGATIYVVWVRPLTAGARPQNIGALALSEGRAGRLDTVTPLATFELTITAEPIGTVMQPSGKVVMRTQVSESD